MNIAKPAPDQPEEFPPPFPEGEDSPLHGFRGEQTPPRAAIPASLTVAISREAGSRGTTIGKRAAAKLGWQFYNQELVEYIVQEEMLRQDLFADLSPEAVRWIEERLDLLSREQNLSQHPTVRDLARIVLALGAQGEAILIGRGAGHILPRESTLHVRLVAPLADRIAYMSQWLRLTEKEAAEQVRLRDAKRAEFLATHFHHRPEEAHQYDLVLNSSLLGEDLCAELIAQAARAKLAAMGLGIGD